MYVSMHACIHARNLWIRYVRSRSYDVQNKNVSSFVTWYGDYELWYHGLFHDSSGGEGTPDGLGTLFARCAWYRNIAAAAAWGCKTKSWWNRPRRQWLPARLLTKQWARVHRSFFPGGKIARTKMRKVCIQGKLCARVFTKEFTLIKLINNASLLWKQEVNHRVHERQKMYSILSEINPLYSIRTWYKIPFNVIFPNRFLKRLNCGMTPS
jgi:hypothetical protein